MDLSKRLYDLRKNKNLTLEQVGNYIGVGKSTVRKWEQGLIKNMRRDKIAKLAELYRVSPDYLLGIDTHIEGVRPIKLKRFRMLGEIACGKPIFANEDHEIYIDASADIKADFCLTAKGDSMTGARIFDGDVVFIKEQSIVENGQIAAVVIGEEVTLKRWYYYPEQKKLVLQAENPRYEPFVFIGEELNNIRCLGRAVSFMSNL